MRHGKKFNHIGRKSAHRKATLQALSIALITHKRINTTVAKAKALKPYLEPLITKSKVDSTHSRRVVFSYLQNKYAVKELFGVISEKISNRPGGYLRILKTNNRLGDNAQMCMCELVDFNETYNPKEKISTKTSRRSRRGSKKKDTTSKVNEIESEVAIAEPPKETKDLTLDKKQMFRKYKKDPRELNMSEDDVVEAIDSFYENIGSEFEYELQLKTDSDNDVLTAGKESTFVVSLTVNPEKEFSDDLLKNFSVRLFSFDLEISGNKTQNVSFADELKKEITFKATPPESGNCKVFVDFWQNTNHLLREEKKYTVA